MTEPTASLATGSPIGTVLVTGGAGFIGSHTSVELLEHGYDVVVVDDFSNSSRGALGRIEQITGRPLAGRYEFDLRDAAALAAVFERHDIDAVIHFAAKKAVGESVGIPLEYYDLNVGATVRLLQAMVAHGVCNLVFSSSCSIYGDTSSAPAALPLNEDSPANPTNPYARSKWMCEQVLADTCRRYPELRAIALRYFNPTGAHPSALLGEDPRGVPNNVMPYLTQLAVGRLEQFQIFGDDYDTVDGTCVRDYIHVVDVAGGHRAALDHLGDARGLQRFNLGTGVGTTVRQFTEAFQAACGSRLPIRIAPRRAGDVATLIADPSRVAAAWGWRTTRDLDDMCADAWAFQQANPVGYDDRAVEPALIPT
ncbi:UDP-glucose 4-epimerase GalE [Cryobacterium sp. AP23]